MKISQNFNVDEKYILAEEDLFFRYTSYQQVEWFFPKHNFSLLESSLHWNLLFFHNYNNPENYIPIKISKINKNVFNIKIEFDKDCAKSTHYIVFAFFQFYLNSNVEKKPDSLSDTITNFHVTYKWDDIYLNLLTYSVTNGHQSINLEELEDTRIFSYDKTGILKKKIKTLNLIKSSKMDYFYVGSPIL